MGCHYTIELTSDNGDPIEVSAENAAEIGLTENDIVLIKGEKGDKGDPGENGADGQPGKQGADGLSAYQIAFDNGFTGTEAEWLASLKGEAGPQGPKGDTGSTGATGPKGDKGDKGETGMTGPQGPQGIQGEKGDSYTLTDEDMKTIADKVTDADTKVDKSGDTMTGELNVPKINSMGDKDKREIATGVNESSYFQSRKFRGEGDANAYYHAVDFGYVDHNHVDFHEYGGLWNFYQNKTGGYTTGLLAGRIQYGKGWVGKVNGYDIGMSLPPGSKLTDTVYDDTALSNRVTVLETKINNLIDGNEVEY